MIRPVGIMASIDKNIIVRGGWTFESVRVLFGLTE